MAAPTAEQIKKADAALARKKAARAAAEKQAAIDSRKIEVQPTELPAQGTQVPLHILNARAKNEDRAIKAKNAEAAKAAAVAVNTVLAGKTRPKPKAGVKASPKGAGEAGAPKAPEGPVKPPKGSSSTKPIPAGAGAKQ